MCFIEIRKEKCYLYNSSGQHVFELSGHKQFFFCRWMRLKTVNHALFLTIGHMRIKLI